jgi:hypothetical protein
MLLAATAGVATAQPQPYPPPSSEDAPPPDAYGEPPQPGPYDQPPPSGAYAQPAPPAGQYAPPPPDAEGPGATYDPRAQLYDREYAQRYSEWAAQNCIDRRNNTIAGAAIGGVFGALLGAGVAGHHDRGAGAVIGGALGATTGAALGANSAACPPGYAVRAGAPAFAAPPVYGYAYPPQVVYGPAWYNPWIWSGGAWVYRPYRYWYWSNGAYWRPGYHPGHWRYRYRRW